MDAESYNGLSSLCGMVHHGWEESKPQSVRSVAVVPVMQSQAMTSPLSTSVARICMAVSALRCGGDGHLGRDCHRAVRCCDAGSSQGVPLRGVWLRRGLFHSYGCRHCAGYLWRPQHPWRLTKSEVDVPSEDSMLNWAMILRPANPARLEGTIHKCPTTAAGGSRSAEMPAGSPVHHHPSRA